MPDLDYKCSKSLGMTAVAGRETGRHWVGGAGNRSVRRSEKPALSWINSRRQWSASATLTRFSSESNP